MNTRTISVLCHAALPAPGADGTAPAWVHLIPAGEFSGIDGRGPYRLADAAAVIAASVAALPVVLDEVHATDLAAPNGGAAPARGWITALESRADGIWGQVEWTGAGRALVEDRAYRGISPNLLVREKDGVILKFQRASLTNTPNLTQLATLHSQQGVTMDLMTRLRTLLGLDEAADEAAVITALESVVGDRTLQSAALGTVRSTLALPATAAPAAILAALQARLGEAGATGALQQTVATLQSQLEAVTAERARDRATAAVDAAITAGKPIKPRRDAYIARHIADQVGTQQDLDALPSLHSGGLGPLPQATDTDGLSPADHKVIALLGVDPKEFAKQKAAQGVAVGSL